jgi:glycosyltransferase involved in cell wall biosynthesis
MINESIMCGTPVVSFRMGVAEDLIINGETGYIVKLKNIRDLANGIDEDYKFR